jgi:hypothetical protein
MESEFEAEENTISSENGNDSERPALDSFLRMMEKRMRTPLSFTAVT